MKAFSLVSIRKATPAVMTRVTGEPTFNQKIPSDRSNTQMSSDVTSTLISLGDLVRFHAERLAMLAPADRRRLEGRVGVVQGYWNFTRKLTVAFPEDSGRGELRILSVDPRQLELVVDVHSSSETEPDIPEPSNGEAKLSQEDTDNLFG